MSLPGFDLLVFCHLRWDFVYQRPQHIISRLAHDHRVLFVEEPWRRPERADHDLRQVTDHLWVLQPNIDSIDQLGSALQKLLPQTDLSTGWFYSPSFVPVLDYVAFDTVIYDCMDELSLFRGAPAQLVGQEQQLLQRADLVFSGGPSLYESKKSRHDRVYCFPSSVDQAHFARARGEGELPEDIRHIAQPIVGYFGVIDERIDLELLAGTADRAPGVSFVMVGPLAKIGHHDLPQRDNIHYLGMKDYRELPDYLRAFSVAMMPFALNDATRFISPTKTLEYMAAGKPIISTAIRDVVGPYGDIVAIVEDGVSFDRAITTALERNAPPDYTNILASTSWDSTVRKMRALLTQTAPQYD